MKHILYFIGVLPLATIMASCDLFGNADDLPSAPIFSSSKAVSVQENLTDTGYSALATTTTRDAIAYSLVGGTDQSLFAINATTGGLVFLAPPDFEKPQDTNSDNDYEIVIQASDGFLASNLTVIVRVTDLSEPTLSETGILKINGIADQDYAGFSVASAGDIDADGVQDIIIGALASDFDGRDGSGASYVIFGSSLAAFTGQVLALDALGESGVVIHGATQHAHIGSAVSSAGDVDGDGFDDILVGSDTLFAGGPPGVASSVHLIYGKTLLSETDGELDLIDLNDGGVKIEAPLRSGVRDFNIGNTVAPAGDIDGDGRADFLFDGVRYRYVIFGGLLDSLTGSSIDINQIKSFGRELIPQNGLGAQYHRPYLTGTGDIDGDGYGDILVGVASGSNPSTFLGFGSAIVNDADGQVALDMTSNAGMIIDGATNSDSSGFSVATVGDIDGDLIPEVVIGAPNAQPNGVENAGEAYLVFGIALRNETGSVFQLSDLGSKGVIIKGSVSSGRVGATVASGGDIDGDGLADLVIGAANDSLSVPVGNPRDVFVIFGKDILSDEDNVIELGELGQAGVVISGIKNVHVNGPTMVAVGDINDDGYGDILIGAPGDGPMARGAAYLISGALIVETNLSNSTGIDLSTFED